MAPALNVNAWSVPRGLNQRAIFLFLRPRNAATAKADTPELSAKRLTQLALKLPTDWAEQRKLLGFQRQ